MEKKLKNALCVLIIVLITIIAFAGVYTRVGTSYESALPKYSLSTDIEGKRITYLKLSDETEEKIYDKDGNEVESIPEGANEEDYKKEEKGINAEEDLNKENYKKVKKILDGRLSDIGVDEYIVRLNEETGDIVVELQDDMSTDNYIGYLTLKGDFQVTDSEDKTVLLDRNDLKSASVFYGDSGTGQRTVYLRILFNKEGAKKLEEVSKEYLQKEETGEESNESDTETDTEESNETTEEEKQKQVVMTINGQTVLQSSFADVMSNGELAMSIGSGSDAETVYSYARQAGVFAMILNNDEMPLTYEVGVSEYIPSEFSGNSLYIVFGILGGIGLIIILYLIFKYKTNGLISAVTFIATSSILALLLRYTGATITFGSFATIAAIMIIQAYFMISILNNSKNTKGIKPSALVFETYKRKLPVVLTLAIISIVFTFMPETRVFSIGMTLFYGIISIALSNFIFMRNMLD